MKTWIACNLFPVVDFGHSTKEKSWWRRLWWEGSFSVSFLLLGKMVGLGYSLCPRLLWFTPAGEWHNPFLVLRPCCPNSSHSAQQLWEQRGLRDGLQDKPKVSSAVIKSKICFRHSLWVLWTWGDSTPSTLEPFRAVLALSVPPCATSSHAPGHPALALCLLKPPKPWHYSSSELGKRIPISALRPWVPWEVLERFGPNGAQGRVGL